MRDEMRRKNAGQLRRGPSLDNARGSPCELSLEKGISTLRDADYDIPDLERRIGMGETTK
jgi:hypothetical protein